MTVQEMTDRQLAGDLEAWAGVGWVEDAPVATYLDSLARMRALMLEAARRLRVFGHDDDGWPLWGCPDCGKPLGESDQLPGEKVCDNCGYDSGQDDEEDGGD